MTTVFSCHRKVAGRGNGKPQLNFLVYEMSCDDPGDNKLARLFLRRHALSDAHERGLRVQRILHEDPQQFRDAPGLGDATTRLMRGVAIEEL